MDVTIAMQHCQAYLDGQLEPALKGEVDAYLSTDEQCAKAFEDQRKFHVFLKRACLERGSADDADRVQALKDKMVAGINGGFEGAKIETKVNEEAEGLPGAASLPASPRKSSPQKDWSQSHNEQQNSAVGGASRRNWFWSIGLAASVVLVVVVTSVLQNIECPYMTACAKNGADILAGRKDGIKDADPKQYLEFVKKEVQAELANIPDLKEYSLKPVGAGKVGFDSLQDSSIPKAAFVRYSGDGQDPVSLQFHPWKGHEPAFFTYDSRQKVWAADHEGYRVVCWRSKGGKVLCSAVGRRPMKQLYQIASLARKSMQRVVPDN